ncbi:DUF4129 domain-containing protein [Paenibacillus herberti]|uniref:Protein-glutamine gamma-glutamyltransferase-like C-terminal domain-containing protein n=1 Tax=Paenibacillus herberti TaxID=1619309 RepID=A0A229NUV0_9BACL|nr:DUF4129 domain-containing protein [Paenibacillus herberti]OXM13648.1 hypothetical protein CGZ75_21750 [Paenibacillus herberti]
MNERRELEGILAGEEYTAYRKGPGFSLWDWLLEGLGRLLKYIFPGLTPGKGTISVFAILIVLALVGFIVWIGWLLLNRRSRTGRLRSGDWLEPGEDSRSWHYYAELGDRHGAEEDWRDGIRAVFLALLFYLEEQGALRVELWKTNREYLDELSESGSSHMPALKEAMELFERIWYGKLEGSQELFESMRNLLTEVTGEGGPR